MCRYLFPMLFILFNAWYWYYYREEADNAERDIVNLRGFVIPAPETDSCNFAMEIIALNLVSLFGIPGDHRDSKFRARLRFLQIC